MNILEDLKRLRKMPMTKTAIQNYIIDIMENFFYSMFDYKKFPDSMPKEFAERYLIWYGMAGAGKVPEKWNKGIYKGEAVFLYAQPAEYPDIYGIGSKIIVTGCNGFNKIASYDEFAIGFNNSQYGSLKNFIVLSSQAITNALSSLRSGVKYTKAHPIYKARDDKEKSALQEYWKKVDDDASCDELAIASSNILDEILEKNNASHNVINLSDANLADKLQYVSKIVDDYMRWCFGLYGQAIQGNGKLAQQTVDEVNGQTSMSFILPNDMLYQRRKWLDRMKAIGIVPEDAEIDFSKAWKVEEVKYENESEIKENSEIDEIEEV